MWNLDISPGSITVCVISCFSFLKWNYIYLYSQLLGLVSAPLYKIPRESLVPHNRIHKKQHAESCQLARETRQVASRKCWGRTRVLEFFLYLTLWYLLPLRTDSFAPYTGVRYLNLLSKQCWRRKWWWQLLFCFSEHSLGCGKLVQFSPVTAF